MKSFPSFALPLTLLVLAACSESPDTAPDQDPVETATPLEAKAGADSNTAAQPRIAESIPENFRGVWDSVQGSCDPASDMRIEVGPEGIGFYEAHGEVTRVEVDNPQKIVVSLAMEGEGEKWTMDRRFTLSDQGQILTPGAVDSEEQFEPSPLKRCEV